MDGSPLAQALALLRQGEAAQAVQMLESMVGRQPEDGAIRHVLGLALLALGRAGESIAHFDLAVASPARTASLHFNRANALSALGRWPEAEADLARAVEMDPALVGAWFNRGNALRQLRRDTEAIACYERALRLQQDFIPALQALAELQLQRGDASQALGQFDRLLSLQPADRRNANLRGVCLHQLGRLDEARSGFEALVARWPDFAEAWNNLGNLQFDLRQLDQARTSLQRAAFLAPDLAEAHNNLGMVQRDLGELARAREQFERALVLRPGYPEALRRRGALNLLEARFAQGWADYQAGNREVRQQIAQSSGLSFWEGQPLAGKSILLSEPSGLGDTLQFLRFLPRLQALGARVAFTGPPSMFRLLSGFDASLELIADPDPRRFDYQCWLMDLAHWLGLGREQDFHCAPYLRAEPERIARWSGVLDRTCFNVGICWQGNPARKMDAARSIALIEFLPLARIPGVRLVNLQKQFGLGQVAPARQAGLELQELGAFDEGPDAFLDSAALLQHLDLVVSADSSTTHLAGALGRPAWLALGRVPDWRWMMDRPDSPWYDSVRLFRQARIGDWQGVFEAMAAQLLPLAAARRTGH